MNKALAPGTSCVFCWVTVPAVDSFGLCEPCRVAMDHVCNSEDEMLNVISYRQRMRAKELHRAMSAGVIGNYKHL